jgi:hypothetical protein
MRKKRAAEKLKSQKAGSGDVAQWLCVCLACMSPGFESQYKKMNEGQTVRILVLIQGKSLLW